MGAITRQCSLRAWSGFKWKFVRGKSGSRTRRSVCQAGRVSAHYFDVLGIHPAMGRNFTEDEDRLNGPNAVILSYELWRNIFDGDSRLIGQAIQLKGEAYTVVGVLPAGAMTPLNADVYTPIKPSRQGEGGGANYEVIVRLRDGANWQQADAEINRAWVNRARRVTGEYHQGAKVSFYTVPLQKGQRRQRSGQRRLR